MQYRFFLLAGILVMTILSACDQNEDEPIKTSDSKSIEIFKNTTDTLLYLQVNDDIVPVYLSIPPNCSQSDYPAVVLLHGSGGMWKNDDRDAGIMSSQNREWQEIFDENCIVGAYVDSYTPRGCIEREGDWKDAPLAFKISSQFVRPLDAYAALDLLRRLENSNGDPMVRIGDEGILGFSDGATALSATLYDTNTTPEGWEWTQSYDREYTNADGINEPTARPEEGGFACGVFYYGGSVGNSYWGGNPCTNEDFMYMNYAPILYQLPENGYLTENSLCAFDVLNSKNAAVTKYIYNDATHGFDGNETEQQPQSDLARSRTIDWFKEHFGIN